MDRELKVMIIGAVAIVTLAIVWCFDYKLQTVDTVPFIEGTVIDVDYAGTSRDTVIQIEGGKRFSLGRADYDILIGHKYRFYRKHTGLFHFDIGVYYEEIE